MTATNVLLGQANALFTEVLELKLTSTAGVFVAIYSTEFAFSCLICLLTIFFGWSRQLPSEFSKEKLGRIAGCFGFLLKVCPRILVLIHYIICIILLAFLGELGNGQCVVSMAPDNITKTSMQRDGIVMVGILSIIWVLMHIGGGITRSIIYVDPFMADPHDPEASKICRCLCISCGP